tara:strand:+ start:21 stop:827 length:807 start_codon:yes stop_codon:yes gene_type:complete
MTNQKISTKKLKAIVFTDMANFTSISAKDEQRALDLIENQNEIIKPLVEKHNGEWLKEIGDGLLFSFDSSLDAVRCSIEIQETLKNIKDLNIRIGIHQGDIFIKEGDVFGDDVNITSRVEAFSPVGGISISDKVNMDIKGVADLKTKFLGHRKLKGVGQDTKIYCIDGKNLNVYRKQWLPYITAFLLMGFSILTFTVITGSFIMEPDYSFSLYIKALIRPLSLFILGYSNYMYVNGVSSKTHKYIVYISYIAILLLIASLTIFLITGE